MSDPFAAAGFVPAEQAPQPAGSDPFAAAGFAPDPNYTPPPPAPAPSHPTAGPTGNFWTDEARRWGTAATNFLAGLGQMQENAGGPFMRNVLATAHGTQPEPAPTPQQIRDNAYNATGATEYVPDGMAGRVGLAARSGALGGLAFGGAPAVLAGAGAGAGGQAGAEMFPGAPNAAAAVGSLLGGSVAATGGNAAKFAVRPSGGSLPIEDAQLAQAARNQGIPLATAQVSNSPFLKYAYSQTSKLPLSGAEAFRDTQQRSFNSALARQMGVEADRITPEVIQRAYDQAGAALNGVAARTGIRFDPQLGSDLSNVVANATGELTPAQLAPIHTQLQNVIGKVRPGSVITGEDYQALTRFDTPLGRAMRSQDVGIRYYANQIRDALDAALQRSASPEDQAALMQARAQWKATRTIEPLTIRSDTPGGATPSTGDISPAALRGRVNQMYQNSGRNPGEMDTLARIGQRFLKEPPSSGTSERMLVNHMLEGTGLAGAAIAGHEAGFPLWAALGVPVATMLAGRVTNSVLRNQLLADQLIRSSLNPNGFHFPVLPGAIGSGPGIVGAAPFGVPAAIAPPTRATP